MNTNHRSSALVSLLGLAIWPPTAPAGPITPPTGDRLPQVRTKRFAIHYEVDPASAPLTSVELWFTRDNGRTWHNYGTDPDETSPIEFIAPAEGLYGYFIVLKASAGDSSGPPSSGTEPQAWAFVDYTPPLVQLHFARFENNDPATRRVQIRWTAYDQFAEKRPIWITFRREEQTTWWPVAGPIPNVGRYDWTLPAKLAGEVSIKLAMRDRAGNLVERISSPIQVPKPKPEPHEVAATQPAGSVIPPPAPGNDGNPYQLAAAQLTLDQIRQADELYDRGGYHLLRGEYPLAYERFIEVLGIDPKHKKARYELAGILLLQKKYDEAIERYKALADDIPVPDNRDALYGMALAYWAKKQYAQARRQLELILAANAHDLEARLKLGDVCWQLGDAIRARQNWAEVTRAKDAKAELVEKADSRLRTFLVTGTRP